MFHVKRGLALPLVAIALLLTLTTACAGGTSSRGWAAPVTSGQLLLVSTGRGHLDGLDAASGRLLWRFPDDWSIPNNRGGLQGIYGAPAVAGDGDVVFVGDYNSRVYAFRPADSALLETNQRPLAGYVDLDGKVIGGLALDVASGNLFVAAGDNLFRVRASDLAGRIVNRDAGVAVTAVFKAGGEVWGTPLLDAGRIYLSSLDGNLYAVSQADGRELWRYTTARALVSSPVLNGTTILVGGFDKKLHAVDASSGAGRWTFEASDWVWSRPAVDSGRVYFGDFDGKLYAVEMSNGNLVWEMDLGRGAIRAGPVISGDTLVVATEDGWVLGIDPRDREKLWERSLGSGIHADLLLSGDDIFLAPRGCATLPGTSERVYYTGIDPQSGQTTTAQGVCR